MRANRAISPRALTVIVVLVGLAGGTGCAGSTDPLSTPIVTRSDVLSTPTVEPVSTPTPTATATPTATPTPDPTATPVPTPTPRLPADSDAVDAWFADLVVRFAPGETELGDDDRQRLRDAATVLDEYSTVSIRVVGRTGSDATLTRRRVELVVATLVVEGVDPSRLEVVTRPAGGDDADVVVFEVA